MKEEKNTHDGDNKRNSDEINKLKEQLMQNTASSKELNNDLESKVKGLEKEKQTLLKDAKALAQSKNLRLQRK